MHLLVSLCSAIIGICRQYCSLSYHYTHSGSKTIRLSACGVCLPFAGTSGSPPTAYATLPLGFRADHHASSGDGSAESNVDPSQHGAGAAADHATNLSTFVPQSGSSSVSPRVRHVTLQQGSHGKHHPTYHTVPRAMRTRRVSVSYANADALASELASGLSTDVKSSTAVSEDLKSGAIVEEVTEASSSQAISAQVINKRTPHSSPRVATVAVTDGPDHVTSSGSVSSSTTASSLAGMALSQVHLAAQLHSEMVAADVHVPRKPSLSSESSHAAPTASFLRETRASNRMAQRDISLEGFDHVPECLLEYFLVFGVELPVNSAAHVSLYEAAQQIELGLGTGPNGAKSNSMLGKSSHSTSSTTVKVTAGSPPRGPAATAFGNATQPGHAAANTSAPWQQSTTVLSKCAEFVY